MVAGFFMSAAHDSRSKPASVVVGNSMVAAGSSESVHHPLIPAIANSACPEWSREPHPSPRAHFVLPADLLFFWAIGKVGPLAPTTLMAAIPAFTLGFQLVFLHEAPSDLSLIGIPIAVLGSRSLPPG